MRNMLLGGKLLAVDAGAKEISLAHLRAALTHLQPVSRQPLPPSLCRAEPG